MLIFIFYCYSCTEIIFIGNIEMHENWQALDEPILTYETLIIIEKVRYLLTWLSLHCSLCDFISDSSLYLVSKNRILNAKHLLKTTL